MKNELFVSKYVEHLYEKEPLGSFPYISPSEDLKSSYPEFFGENLQKIKKRKCKRYIDIILGSFFLIIAFPVILLLFISNFIEGLIIAAHRGPFLYYYYSVSHGEKIKKWKIRQVIWDTDNEALRATHDWIAFSEEWNKSKLTYTGAFVKKFYLDELPQFISIIRGDISLVGPRPLCVNHYLRDLHNGNTSRFLIPGGLLGLGHLNKGTDEMGQPVFEYKYVASYHSKSCLRMLLIDFKILYRGLLLIFKGGGH